MQSHRYKRFFVSTVVECPAVRGHPGDGQRRNEHHHHRQLGPGIPWHGPELYMRVQQWNHF